MYILYKDSKNTPASNDNISEFLTRYYFIHCDDCCNKILLLENSQIFVKTKYYM